MLNKKNKLADAGPSGRFDGDCMTATTKPKISVYPPNSEGLMPSYVAELVEQEARDLLRHFTKAGIEAIANGHYGARDVRFAVALLAKPDQPWEKLPSIRERLIEMKEALETENAADEKDDKELRRLLREAHAVIEAFVSDRTELLEELAAEGWG